MYSKNGFTLVEILLVISLLGLIASVFISSNMTGYKVFVFSSSQVNLQHYSRIISNRIAGYIREAKELEFNLANGDLISIILSNDLNKERNYEGIAFGLVNEQVYYRKKRVNGNWGYRNTFSHDEQLKIKDLTFSYLEDQEIVVMDISIKNQDLAQKYSFSERFFLRNEI